MASLSCSDIRRIMSVALPFLSMGYILSIFHSLGQCDDAIYLLNKVVTGAEKRACTYFRSILSQSDAFSLSTVEKEPHRPHPER